MKKRTVSLISIVMVAILTVASSFAWLGRIFGDIDFTDDLIGSTETAYFARGDGSEENPYVITNRTHMYNLAWLQYLGYFNMATSGNNGKAQSYFKLESDVDMEGLCLPPIGTVEYPFLGNFSGGGFVIANAKTTNVKSEYEYKPTNANFSGELLAKAVGGNGEVGNVSGLFGVVGDYDGALAKVNEAAALIGVTSASQEIINVSDFYLSGANIKSGSAGSLVGIIAGYVNAGVSNIGVYGCSLDVPNGGAIDDISANVSDYTMVGYCTDEYKKIHSTITTDIYQAEYSQSKVTFEADGGSGTGWGGSVDMESMYNRLVAIYNANNNNGYADFYDNVTGKNIFKDEDGNIVSSETVTDGNFKYYYDSDIGSFIFCRYNKDDDYTDYMYLYGNETKSIDIVTYLRSRQNVEAYYISQTSQGGGNRTYYLTTNGSNVTNANNKNSAAKWYLNESGYLQTELNAKCYFLNAAVQGNNNRFSLSISETAQTEWQKNGNYLTCVLTTDNRGQSYQTTCYLIYNRNNGWTISTNANALTFETVSIEMLIEKIAQTSKENITLPATYFPLQANSAQDVAQDGEKKLYGTKDNNTGYVVSGYNYKKETFDYYGTTYYGYPYGSGDIRVSKYEMDNISVALNGSSYTSGAGMSNLEVLTRTYKTNGALQRVSDDYNVNNSNISSSVKGYTKASIADLGLTKYDKSRDSIDTLFSGASDIYGLHFMDSVIGKNNLVTAEKVIINGQEFANYQLPADSINFHLKEKGYIDFYAGTYFNGNDSFFSLHQIFRNDNNEISEIKEIESVWGNLELPNYSFVYKYADGTYSSAYMLGPNGQKIALSYNGNYPEGYECLFETDWIKNPELIQNAIYYYEIPMNDGEFALGSVQGKTGAYLIYLDISANAQESMRTTVTERIDETTRDYVSLDLSVNLVVDSTGTIGQNNLSITLNSNFTGKFSLDLNNQNDIVYSGGGANVELRFIEDGLTLKDNSGNEKTAVPIDETTTTTKRLTYNDYNLYTQETYMTIRTDIVSAESETTEVKQIAFDVDGNELDSPIIFDKFLSDIAQETVTLLNTQVAISYFIIFDSDREVLQEINMNAQSVDADPGYVVASGYTVTVTYEDDSTALPEENFEVIKNVLPVTINGKRYA